jgi:hypothetical protein
VRRLHRTSLPIPTAAGIQAAKAPHHILGGLLTLASSWSPPLGAPLTRALASADDDQKMDFICIADVGTWERQSDDSVVAQTTEAAATLFSLTLIARLQDIATVPMIDVRAYTAWLK